MTWSNSATGTKKRKKEEVKKCKRNYLWFESKYKHMLLRHILLNYFRRTVAFIITTLYAPKMPILTPFRCKRLVSFQHHKTLCFKNAYFDAISMQEVGKLSASQHYASKLRILTPFPCRRLVAFSITTLYASKLTILTPFPCKKN